MIRVGDGGRQFHQNVGVLIPGYVASYQRRQETSIDIHP
jgi:hypothetical protein